MRFTQQKNGSYRAVYGRNDVLIRPSHGGWQVTINAFDVEWFIQADLAKAKAFAKARIAEQLWGH